MAVKNNNESAEEPEKPEVRSKAANFARYNNTDIVVILSDKKKAQSRQVRGIRNTNSS